MNASVKRIGSVRGGQSAMGHGSNLTRKVIDMNDLEGSFGVQGELTLATMRVLDLAHTVPEVPDSRLQAVDSAG